jgi:hypothetical protein
MRSIAFTVPAIAAGLLTACGPSSNTTPTPSPARTSSSSSSSSSSSTTDNGTGNITVGSVVYSSTLEPPTSDMGTSASVTQDQNGLTLSVDKPAGGYTFTELKDFHGIPEDMAVRVHVAEAAPASGIYYGIACRGFGQNEKYLLLSDATGKWAIVQVKSGNQTVLKQGTVPGVDATQGVTVDAACVTPDSNDKMNHLVLSLNGKVAGTVDDSFDNVSISNNFQLFAISPDTTTGTGSVVFNRLEVRSASAP